MTYWIQEIRWSEHVRLIGEARQPRQTDGTSTLAYQVASTLEEVCLVKLMDLEFARIVGEQESCGFPIATCALFVMLMKHSVRGHPSAR